LIKIRNLHVHYASQQGVMHAVRGVDITIQQGQFYTMLGPSGCGKTTTLRSVAGLERPTSGEIEIDSQLVYSAERRVMVPPHKRDIGMVFQSYAIWPHMTVFENVAFPLQEMRGRFNKALFFAAEGHLDPRAALGALARRLEERGVPIRFGVAGAMTAPACWGAPAAQRQVVDCTGLAARGVLSDLRGVKGEMLLLRLPDISLSRPVRVLHPRIPLYIVPRGNGLFMVGATMIESDQETRITARSMLELLSAAYALHPAFGEAEIVEIGTGVRPAFPDNLPRIRWYGDTLYVNGLFRHGFLLAPALARRVAGILLEERYFPEVQDEDPRERRLA